MDSFGGGGRRIGAVPRVFLIIASGFIGSAIGTGFGGLVRLWFSGFLGMIWVPQTVDPTAQIGAGMGMVLGLPIGAATMAAGRFIGAVRHCAGIREGNTADTVTDKEK